MVSEKRGKPGRPRKDETVMKVLTKGIPMPVEEEPSTPAQHIGLNNLEYRPPEIIKKRKRGRPRKNIKFCPLVSNKGMVFEEEAEEEIENGMMLGKRVNRDYTEVDGEQDGEDESDNAEIESPQEARKSPAKDYEQDEEEDSAYD